MSKHTTTSLFKVFPVLRKAVFGAFDKQNTKLTRTQQIILMTMAGTDSLSMSGLAKCINTSNEQATRAVSQLVDLGFVIRSQNEQNHRIVNIGLTDKAQQYLREVEAAAEQSLAESVGRENVRKTNAALLSIIKYIDD